MPEDWVKADDIAFFVAGQTIQTPCSGAKRAALDQDGDHLLLGGTDGSAGVYSLPSGKLVERLDVEAPVTDTLWADALAITATALGSIKSWNAGKVQLTSQLHNGPVTALALHPSKEILASVGIDKTCTFYDLTSNKQAALVGTDSGE